MIFKQFDKIEDCKRLWEKYSPKESLWEVWDFNWCFYDSRFNKLYFIVGIEDKKELGLLPLMWDQEKGCYGFFGGDYPERRRFFIKDKLKIVEFVRSVKGKICLEYIDDSEKSYIGSGPLSDTSFSLDLKKYPTINSFFERFSKKHRKNLKYDLRKLEKLNYKLEWNNITDFERLVELNRKRFGEESNYCQLGFTDGMKRLIDIADRRNMLNMVSIKINGKIEAAEIGVIYNNVYYVLDGGANLEVENIGKLLIITHIKRAIELGALAIDFLSSDSGWKRLWNLEETKQWEWCNYE
jgi:hypothetical protein